MQLTFWHDLIKNIERTPFVGNGNFEILKISFLLYNFLQTFIVFPLTNKDVVNITQFEDKFDDVDNDDNNYYKDNDSDSDD